MNLWIVGVLVMTSCMASLCGSMSWVESANDPETDFPLENLPFGVFSTGETDRRIGVAIGDYVVDLKGFAELCPGVLPHDGALKEPTLRGLLELSSEELIGLKRVLRGLLNCEPDDERLFERRHLLLPVSSVQMHMPIEIGDYTDFYTSLAHATHVGKLFRPTDPLIPNFKHMPLGYHGRASSVMISGSSVHRPCGQLAPEGDLPARLAPVDRLDYEMELGVFVRKGNRQGTSIAIGDAAEHLFGLVILNDWSARDVQKWEYVPLGPFNAKNFATSISPWVVTLDALAPYRVQGPPRSEEDPQVLDYLKGDMMAGLNIVVEVSLLSQKMRQQGLAPCRISRGNFATQFWTFEQMLVHHTSTGCNMRPGDLIGSGTISEQSRNSRGCLLEFLLPDGEPIQLPDGTIRRFLLDGDEVIMRAHAELPGLPRIGFGECRGLVLPCEAKENLPNSVLAETASS